MKKFATTPHQVYAHTHCLLCIDDVVMDDSSWILGVGSTDGQILLFDIKQYREQTTLNTLLPEREHQCSPVVGIRNHQSGVNALKLRLCDTDSLTLISGGDDGAVSISRVDTTSWTVLSTATYPHQHSSQVTGNHSTSIQE